MGLITDYTKKQFSLIKNATDYNTSSIPQHVQKTAKEHYMIRKSIETTNVITIV